MNFPHEQTLVLYFIGAALFVLVVSVLWGNLAKSMGAGMVLASILSSNIIFDLFVSGQFSRAQLGCFFALLDAFLVFIFFYVLQSGNRLERHYWAGLLSCIQMAMVAVNLKVWIFPGVGGGNSQVIILNTMMLLAILVCFIAFIPKSRDEAVGILKIKWLYLKSDFFARSAPLNFFTIDCRVIMAPVIMAPRKNNHIDLAIGAKLREARIIRGLSRRQLADILKLSTAQIQRYENGEARISASALFRLSEILGQDVSFFYEAVAAESFMPPHLVYTS